MGEVVGTLAVILASLFYASAGIYGQLRLHGTTSGPVLATGNMLAAGLMLLPFAIVSTPPRCRRPERSGRCSCSPYSRQPSHS